MKPGSIPIAFSARSIAAGRARVVELVADGARNAFLSGPLELRQGVTLLVSAGVTLFGSRDPRLYDVKLGSCGIVTLEDGRGCKPLVHAGGVADAAVMGGGTIDGRGGAKLLGQTVSWWDLAQDAKVRTRISNVRAQRLRVQRRRKGQRGRER